MKMSALPIIHREEPLAQETPKTMVKVVGSGKALAADRALVCAHLSLSSSATTILADH